MKISRFLFLFFVFGIGWMSAAVLPPTALLPERFTAAATNDAAQAGTTLDRVAQQDYGSRCSTADGVCALPRPLPIGSICYCGSSRGTTIR
jgi:hypothetical protein